MKRSGRGAMILRRRKKKRCREQMAERKREQQQCRELLSTQKRARPIPCPNPGQARPRQRVHVLPTQFTLFLCPLSFFPFFSKYVKKDKQSHISRVSFPPCPHHLFHFSCQPPFIHALSLLYLLLV